MRSKEKVLAIFLADIHLSLNPPVWRSAEPNWFEAMLRPILEVKALQEKYDCPVIAAGDIFNTWYSPPEVINFALEHLPYMYAIPGQHDLPLHNYEDIQKSAYWTLVGAGRIQNLPLHRSKKKHTSWPIQIGDLAIYGFPFGEKVRSLQHRDNDFIHIAVIHEYRCIKGKDYYKASNDDYLYENERNLLGYDVVVYGDNHQGFQMLVNEDTAVFNCGSLMRRKSDEINYKPQVGLLLKSGKVISHYLDTSKDKHLILNSTTDIKETPDMRTLIQELEKLDGIDLDFSEVMVRYLKKNRIKKTICNIIMEAMGL